MNKTTAALATAAAIGVGVVGYVTYNALVVEPPEPASGVLHFGWKSNGGDGFVLRWGTNSGAYVRSWAFANVTNAFVEAWTPIGMTNYFSIAATNANGTSSNSSEVVVSFDAVNNSRSVLPAYSRVVLWWTGSGQTTVQFSDGISRSWTNIATTTGTNHVHQLAANSPFGLFRLLRSSGQRPSVSIRGERFYDP